MAMGSTGAVNITKGMMADITSAVNDYRQKTNVLAQKLEDEVNDLIPEYFNGDAARGFKSFYDKNIVPANGEGLKNLLDAIDNIADSILKAIPGEGGLDEQLADGNQQ